MLEGKGNLKTFFFFSLKPSIKCILLKRMEMFISSGGNGVRTVASSTYVCELNEKLIYGLLSSY